MPGPPRNYRVLYLCLHEVYVAVFFPVHDLPFEVRASPPTCSIQGCQGLNPLHLPGNTSLVQASKALHRTRDVLLTASRNDDVQIAGLTKVGTHAASRVQQPRLCVAAH